jgi:hypothetical protein
MGIKINKKTLVVLTVLVLMTLPTVPVFAINKDSKAPINGLEKSANDHLYLFQKDDTKDWQIVDDPKWAKMNFNNKKSTFVFNAHGLTGEEDFELICYLDPWPAYGSILLGSATSDAQGNLHMKGEIDFTVLREASVAKFEEYPQDTVLKEGLKIYLVPAAHFDEDAQVIIGWNQTEVLFEFGLLTF